MKIQFRIRVTRESIGHSEYERLFELSTKMGYLRSAPLIRDSYFYIQGDTGTDDFFVFIELLNKTSLDLKTLADSNGNVFVFGIGVRNIRKFSNKDLDSAVALFILDGGWGEFLDFRFDVHHQKIFGDASSTGSLRSELQYATCEEVSYYLNSSLKNSFSAMANITFQQLAWENGNGPEMYRIGSRTLMGESLTPIEKDDVKGGYFYSDIAMPYILKYREQELKGMGDIARCCDLETTYPNRNPFVVSQKFRAMCIERDVNVQFGIVEAEN